MSSKIGEMVWFDIPVNDFERSKVFYSELLGWQFELMGPDYWLIKVDKEPIGGLKKSRTAITETEMPILYFKVDRLDPAVRRIKSLGGTLIGERMDIPNNMGCFHLFRDKDKNLLGLWAQS